MSPEVAGGGSSGGGGGANGGGGGGGGGGSQGGTGGLLESALAQLGHFQLYQRYVLLLLCLPNLLSAMYSLNYVFVADQVEFRCFVPECESGADAAFDSPPAEALLPAESRCLRPRPLEPHHPGNVTCAAEHFHPNDTIACEHFVYENEDTIFVEFDMACRGWMRSMVGTVRNIALPVALVLTGYVSDSWGRRTAFCIFGACAGVLGIVKSLSVNYQMYLAFEFFEAALGYGFNSAGYVMLVESARPSLRAAYACSTGVTYGLGGVLFALLAWRVPYWRQLLRVMHAPALLLPVYWLLLDESPRWLHAQGRLAETAKVIRKAARWNKQTLDEELMKALEEESEETKEEKAASEGNPWLSLLRSRVLMTRFALCCWCWVCTTLVYYGLTINSVSLSGDKYANFALNMAMEVVASLLLVMALDRFGRKRSIFVAFLLCGIACVVPYFFAHTRAGFSLFFVGKLAITFAFNSVYVFTLELFPTRTRSSALAACSLLGRAGSLVAMWTPMLSLMAQALVYGACALSAALLVLLAPETRRAPLPPSVRAAERMRTDEHAHDHAPRSSSASVIDAPNGSINDIAAEDGGKA